MPSTSYRIALLAPIVLLLFGCSPAGQPATPVEFTQDMAEATLTKIVAGVGESGVTDFCSRHVQGTETCDILLKSALDWCLLPGDKPRVSRAAQIPAKNGSQGGWLLEIKGRTQDGQDYVSEFFAVQPQGRAVQAAFGIYWTGLGLEESPFGPGNTRIPQNACPKR